MIMENDIPVIFYQQTNNPLLLIETYQNFLNKYYNLLVYHVIDFENYDIRYFLSCYIQEKKVRKELRRGKHHTKRAVAAAHDVLKTITGKLRLYTSKEIYHEILIPFLEIAKLYQEQGIGFEKYLYKTYKFELKRHLEEMKWDILDHYDLRKQDISYDMDWSDVEKTYNPFDFEMDEGFELSDPRWIHGKKTKAPFDQFDSHERYILVKYYIEEKTDKEIARLLPYHPKSIHRIRMRCVNRLIEQYHKGELKWIRLSQVHQL